MSHGAPKNITIVGGGLAGLTLGIGLKTATVNLPVTIYEAGHYPRHRVCGEFISGRGHTTLARLGLLELLDGHAWRSPALALDRRILFHHPLKRTLARCQCRPFAFRASCWMTCWPKNSANSVANCLKDDTNAGDFSCWHRSGCTGREARSEPGGPGWFGLKIYARNLTLAADLEMHASAQGYVGLCKINGGVVNVCGLFRAKGRTTQWRSGKSVASAARPARFTAAPTACPCGI